MDNNFCVSIERKRIDDNEYEKLKQIYLSTGDGDAKIVIYSLCQTTGLKNWINEDLFVLTEETRLQNDGKLFKKLPLMRDGLGIKTIKVVDYLEKSGISLKIENRK